MSHHAPIESAERTQLRRKEIRILLCFKSFGLFVFESDAPQRRSSIEKTLPTENQPVPVTQTHEIYMCTGSVVTASPSLVVLYYRRMHLFKNEVK